MKEKSRNMVTKIAAPFRKAAAVVKKPFAKVYARFRPYLEKLSSALKEPVASAVKIVNKYSIVFHALWAILLEFVIEAFSRHSLVKGWMFAAESPWVFLYNSLLIFMTFMIVYLFRRRFFVRVGLSAVWIYLGYMNGTVLSNRVTPFTAQDIKLLDDLADIISKYMSPDKLLQNVGMVVIALVVLFVFWKKGPKYQGKIHYIRNAAGLAAVIAVFAASSKFALENRIISSYFGNIAFAYEDYGFPYCFSCTLVGTGMDKPYDYGEEMIRDLTDWEEEVPEELPNIIFVQLESFFDVSTVEYLECSEDPIPYFRSLMEEYSSGSYKVPSVGAGTANTEFETVTGMNMRYFGPGEYPYKTVLKKTTCESIPYVLDEIGYATHAIHNNKATFYSRVDVFPNLGFESFTSKEYMDITNQTETGWLKDEILVDCVMDCLQSTEEQDYVFTVSVQGHGDYPKEKILEDPVITISGSPTKSKDNQWEYYVNQIHEMDIFVKDLIEAVDSLGEDSVIVFYGDHLPTMDLTEEDVTNRYLFDTSYVIWNNMGLERKEQTLCAYQIGAEVLNQIGIHKGTMVQYHQYRRGTKNYQSDMEMVQYDILYGKKYAYDQEDLYQRKDMRMGIKDASIDRVIQIEDKVYIFGENFTTQTKVYVNEEYYSTGYINDHLIRVKKLTLEDGDEVAIKQLAPGSKKRVLSEEDCITYEMPAAEEELPAEETFLPTEEETVTEETITQ
ncbi:MAG: LTA synthase family protein [Lachnospiraceae bacterium]